MIYLDTSVALAAILSEDRRPPDALWAEPLVSSRLLEYETMVRLRAYGLTRVREAAARDVLARTSFVELVRPALERALDAFPVPVRTLDALHLATLDFLRARRADVVLASYDQRMVGAARAMGFPLFPL